MAIDLSSDVPSVERGAASTGPLSHAATIWCGVLMSNYPPQFAC